MRDDGAGEDAVAGDRVYTAVVDFPANGPPLVEHEFRSTSRAGNGGWEVGENRTALLPAGGGMLKLEPAAFRN